MVQIRTRADTARRSISFAFIIAQDRETMLITVKIFRLREAEQD
jgi:hypothetical protein